MTSMGPFMVDLSAGIVLSNNFYAKLCEDFQGNQADHTKMAMLEINVEFTIVYVPADTSDGKLDKKEDK
uniref:Uncharacterized protein n=1 Tax=Onchocerca volvulus TaxID=6282 RepID=A0A8R1TKE3_ONCVO